MPIHRRYTWQYVLLSERCAAVRRRYPRLSAVGRLAELQTLEVQTVRETLLLQGVGILIPPAASASRTYWANSDFDELIAFELRYPTARYGLNMRHDPSARRTKRQNRSVVKGDR